MSYPDANQPVQLPPPSNRVRRMGQIFMLVLVPVILLGGLVLGFRMLSGSGAAPEATAAPEVAAQIPAQPSPVPTVAPTLLAANTLTPTLAPTLAPTPIPPEQIVAVVNGQVVTTETVRMAQAVDEAMTDLLGRPTEAQETLLERVINLTLTGQAADRAGFVLDSAVVGTTQTQLLDQAGRSLDDLTGMLAQRGVTLGQFEIYLGQLLRSEQFLRQQAQSSGSTAPLVLQRTQDEAQISLGMAAADFAALPSPLPTPSPTPPPVAESNATPPPTPDLVQRERGIGVGQLLPDFSLPTLSLDEAATPVSLGADDLIGTPTVLSFYTTWCPYCERQTPILVESAASALGQGVQFVGIDVKEPGEVTLPYVQRHGILYPVLLDESGSAATAYGVPGYPTTYFIDRLGQIVDRHIGALTAEHLSAYLDRISQ
ncbi:MAG: redoxin domain-containing protein [Caldilineaceae bacterium]|nr:redoxin domain-containing protein [Caldilineaceae bacterium]MBP8109989.1 redoxin domain-containing protein [Caldilineaceae bacterium]MBP8125148.1 redoxin domain-containing protein [Caldilineaceae bacterium]MBP9072104.1 redoxin domain-containing protein [Caldilineaceae bacterium]